MINDSEEQSNWSVAGGQLKISVNGREQIYTSSGLDDGWNTAVYSFTATGSTATLKLEENGLEGISYFPFPTAKGFYQVGGSLGVDSLSTAQIRDAIPMVDATGATTSSVFGTVTDGDAGAALKGWAITSAAADNAGHHWQYSTDNGTTWANMDAASTSQAIYLSTTDLVRWTGVKGTNSELDAKAVDNTGPALHAANAAATLVDASVSGGTTAFSANTSVLAAHAAPLVFDLNQDGQLDFTHTTLSVDGHTIHTDWAGANDGILLWDKFGDGTLQDSSQYVFGQNTGSDLSGLAQTFDSNKDDLFDDQDTQFKQFGVWQDGNQDGVVDAGEFLSLAALGIASLSLTNDPLPRSHVSDDVEVNGYTHATLADGAIMLVADAIFSYIDIIAEPPPIYSAVL
jgi:hypothetical protein